MEAQLVLRGGMVEMVECFNNSRNVFFAAIVDNVEVGCESGRTVNSGCGTVDDNEVYFIIAEQTKQCFEVSHLVNVLFFRRVEALPRIPATS